MLIRDIKKLLKANDIIVDTESIKNIIKTIFPECDFCEFKCFNYIKLRNVIICLKAFPR